MSFHLPQPPAGLSAGTFKWEVQATPAQGTNPVPVFLPSGQSSAVGDIRVVTIVSADPIPTPATIADPDGGAYTLLQTETNITNGPNGTVFVATSIYWTTVQTARADESGQTVTCTFLQTPTQPSITVEEFAAPGS